MFCVCVQQSTHFTISISLYRWEIHVFTNLYTGTYLFITISKYIKVNSNSFNHCRPTEHNTEKSAAQEWQHTTLGGTRINVSLGIHIYILSIPQFCWNSPVSCSNFGMLTAITATTLIIHQMPRRQPILQNRVIVKRLL